MSRYSWSSSVGTSPSSSSPGSVIFGPYSMSSSRTNGNFGVAQRASTWQDELEKRNLQKASKMRSATDVVITGPTVDALYWYDGQYVNGAKEDAAEQACRRLGIQERKKDANSLPSVSFAGSKGRVEGWGTVR
ncbi:uncharacterized protein KY384_003183 [Bacidia gigantensis]|uniref:uncharacterized protein n=1 Tax=Bacidia gigantensis TaxID=2732470 RepID=UPI001D041B82|nr:uncharacterized protein KY384_003183 [Bacidia gigantensis]KAG8531553.1 hypothetical protein KY384_003183 [Bacidia gigantensis]